jgi:hypothetical protein
MADAHRLFTVTRWLLKAATIFCAFISVVLILAFIAVVLALGALLVMPSLLPVFSIPLSVEGVPLATILSAALFLVAGGVIGTVMVFLAIRATSGIVDTAMAGDPFIADNAERLKHIGWLLLGVMVVQFLTAIMVGAIAPDNNIAGHIDPGDGGPSLTGLLAVLLIFVLARIFRHGTQMRADLEGTV